jgi:hypothetical protein
MVGSVILGIAGIYLLFMLLGTLADSGIIRE